eukprot:GFKZ01011463.1.p1 GENE.GFKZ01011463.1~~GFKZ01011463.1.p1  ORF type:complete len:431 (-),score=57.64 GFKZ01011463.1:1189-2358(-)
MTAPSPAAQYLASRIESAANSADKDHLVEIQRLYNHKLWHQLTQKVHTVVTESPLPNMRDLYDKFLSTFESHLNPITLTQILATITALELSDTPSDALAFLQPLVPSPPQNTIFTKSPSAHILLLSHIALLHMKSGDHSASKKTFQQASELLDRTEMTPPVYSVYFRAAAEYHKVVGTAYDFFHNALQFLAYTPAHTLSTADQTRWAFDIGIAALVGTAIYNFGEVLSHSIVHSLKSTDHEWLFHLLEAFNNGDLDQFDKVCNSASAKMNAQPVLVAHEEFLKQKITILALLELAFTRSLDASIPFADVERACRLPSKEVEYLLMRAMSLGLISGVIDHVDQSFEVTRVRPRVLGREPIGEMAKRLEKWCGKVDTTLDFVSESSVGIAD